MRTLPIKTIFDCLLTLIYGSYGHFASLLFPDLYPIKVNLTKLNHYIHRCVTANKICFGNGYS